MSTTEQQKKFFFAEYDAGMYDGTVELVCPQYAQAHETMWQLFNLHFLRGGREALPSDVVGTVLDIGSGSGKESLRILKEFPNIKIVAIDLFNEITEQFKENFKKELPAQSFSERVLQIFGDFVGEAGETDNMKKALKDFTGKDEFQAIVSGFTLHHFDHEQKRKAYQRISDLLAPGGLLLNGDLFNYESEKMSAYADKFDMKFIRDSFNEKGKFVAPTSPTDAKNFERLRDLWITHYRRDNILSSAETQSAMLTDLGFSHVAIPFRYWQVGILWAVK